MNTITINFIECDPAPASGYNLKWRVAGSGDPYTDEGNFSSSPIIFIDNISPPGTCYEGTIQSDCSESGDSGSLLGNAIPWSTPCGESGTTDYTIRLLVPCSGIPSSFIIENGTISDVIKVRATFGGMLQRLGGAYTNANLYISSPDGTSDNDSSASYTDTSYHNFILSVESTITMTATTAFVNTSAFTNNSSSSMSSLNIEIIEINGVPVSGITASGCKGDNSTG